MSIFFFFFQIIIISLRAQCFSKRQLFVFQFVSGQAHVTREYLRSIKQGDLSLPGGPVLLNPTSLISALHRWIDFIICAVFDDVCKICLSNVFVCKICITSLFSSHKWKGMLMRSPQCQHLCPTLNFWTIWLIYSKYDMNICQWRLPKSHTFQFSIRSKNMVDLLASILSLNPYKWQFLHKIGGCYGFCFFHLHTVICLLKARTAEPKETCIARQWLFEHVSMATTSHDCSNSYMNTTIEELLEAMFSLQSVPLYKE